MRVHHLNCGTMCPVGRRFVNGDGGILERGRMVCHCLLVETNDGLVLVDTGLGLTDCTAPRGRLHWGFRVLTSPAFDTEETAARRVERLGFRRDDVRHIVVTHLDVDHAGGIGDFPGARVHVFADEHDAATRPSNLNERMRYVQAHWAHGPRWETHALAGEKWHGFGAVRAIEGVGTDVLLVPLAGHTRGHCGVAVRAGDRWLLHAGDAYFFHAEVHAERPRCPPGLRLFQRTVAHDDALRRRNQRRLRELVRTSAGEVSVFSAHCLVDFARLQDEEHAPAVEAAAPVQAVA
jgi:glyoxylase-like metal-dependent hydrolase (beta-lactamase superfamily II)